MIFPSPWERSMKPPAPARTWGWAARRLTLALPAPSTSAKARQPTLTPPPSMRSNWAAESMMASGFGGATGDDFLGAERGRLDGQLCRPDLAAYGWVVGDAGVLPLLRVHHDGIHQDARDLHPLRGQGGGGPQHVHPG